MDVRVQPELGLAFQADRMRDEQGSPRAVL